VLATATASGSASPADQREPYRYDMYARRPRTGEVLEEFDVSGSTPLERRADSARDRR
jgi:hypothetical protein